MEYSCCHGNHSPEYDLTYSDLISESVMELRMAPRQEQDQHRLSFTLGVGPPTSAFSYFDWLGNSVHAFTVNSFHEHIRIVAVRRRGQKPIACAFSPSDLPTGGQPARPVTITQSVGTISQFGGPVQDMVQKTAAGASWLRSRLKQACRWVNWRCACSI